jgi:hypothetical protein
MIATIKQEQVVHYYVELHPKEHEPSIDIDSSLIRVIQETERKQQLIQQQLHLRFGKQELTLQETHDE